MSDRISARRGSRGATATPTWLAQGLRWPLGLAVLLMAPVIHVQAEDEGVAQRIEEVVVTGTRATIQTSIATKRNADLLVEALSAEDIGDLPALSIGEALETLTGAASHREQGGATEISIRGLGPFLGSTTLNGREATNGSGDRSVNFSQFPSELFNRLQIYKTQQANLIEGGVSGQIALETVRPLDYGRRRLQLGVKANWNPDNEDLRDPERNYGYRGTASFIDQFDFEFGEIGISLGIQTNRGTNPEQEFRSSSTYRDCRFDPTSTAGVFASGNCDSGAGDLVLEVDPTTGVAPDEGVPFIFVPSGRTFRQNVTDDERDAIFGAFQWRTDRLELNIDTQYSDRTFTEDRNDLTFAENRRIDPASLVANADGTVISFSNEGRVETHSMYQERLEEYFGFGANLAWQVTDSLRVSIDGSYSDTARLEHIYQTRLQSEPTDIFGNPTPAGTDRPIASYDLYPSNSNVPLVTLTNFDVTDHNLFADNARTRIDLNQARDNTITAFRTDMEYVFESGFLDSVEAGLRYSKLEYSSFPRVRDEFTFSDADLAVANQQCRNREFPEGGFLSDESNGNPLITNIDGAGNIIPSGTGRSWATFRPLCLVRQLIGTVPNVPNPERNVSNVDLEEETRAGYVQFNYDGELGGFAVRGNFGVRVVETDVESNGLRTTFITTDNPDGTINVLEDGNSFISVSGGSSYTEWLPSVNLVVDLRDDLLLRAGVFRGLSRPDPADLGFGRRFDVDDSDDPTSINDLIGTAVAPGNPDLEPLTSWNYDLALEWYPNEDSILAVSMYYKSFLGGFENVQRTENFEVDGQIIPAIVTTTQTDDDESDLFGVEVTAATRFSWLPAPFDGLGTKISYNYADSDFEFEDQNFGASLLADPDGNVVSERVGIVDPANIFGLSEHVLSAQIYYGWGPVDVSLIYKYRSEYFQQFISTPGLIRYIDDVGVWEGRVSYDITDNIEAKLEVINLFNEPRRQRIPNDSNLSEVNSYGPRVFLGLRAKF